MDEHLNNRQKEVILRLLANPADTGEAYLSNLQELVKMYPQSGLFRALYGRALNQPTPLVAGGYFDSIALHKLLFHHDSLAQVDHDEVVMQSPGKLFGAPPAATATTTTTPQPSETPHEAEVQSSLNAEEQHTVEPVEETLPEYHHFEATEPALAEARTETETAAGPADTEEPLGRAPWELDEDEEEPAVTEQPASQPAGEQSSYQIEEPSEYTATEVTSPITEETQSSAFEAGVPSAPWETIQTNSGTEPVWEMPWREEETEPAVSNAPASEDLASKLAYYASLNDEYDNPVAGNASIEDETYNEITGIDEINLSQISAEPIKTEPTHDEAERLIMGNIASTDFFTFDKAFGENPPAAATTEPEYRPEYFARPQEDSSPQQQPTEQPQAAPAQEPAHHDVSRYHDEKMPYTFMWWLDKTRREHGSLYQPYTKAPVARPADKPAAKSVKGDALQQQYVENIFHLNTPEGLVKDADAKTIEFDMQSKEDRIIQRFIIEDPHIHPPVGEKLDTENKAKRSSEDSDEMVTETLARIYADQMLFPKAIATYKKLMLKFPEKSRYFASRIENLEKRTN